MPGCVQAQWSLDSTSDNLISVSRGIIVGATSDNVDLFTILACEHFGNTVAMSRNACNLIEQRLLPTLQYAVVGFIQALVGYSPDDCASQLGKTQAGIQFLGLATALLSTMGLFESAERIGLMIKNSASDRRLLPKNSQVKQLLASIEPRCHRADFLNFALDWQRRLQDIGLLLGDSPSPLQNTSWYPTVDGLEQLVSAFRSLQRVGKPTVTKVSIQTTACTPWVAAFTVWCLGTRPSIYVDDGRNLVSEPQSQVIITTCTGVNTDSPVGFEVTVYDEIEGPKLLINSGIQGPWAGLTRIKEYGKWLLRTNEMDRKIQVLEEILPSAIDQVLRCVRFSNYRQFDNKISLDQWPFVEGQSERPQIDENMLDLRVYPFPSFSAVAEMAALLTDGKVTKLHPLEQGLLITNLPVTTTFLKDLGNQCGCLACAAMGTRNADFSGGNMFKRCERKLFFSRLSIIIADILALSLFYCPDDLRTRIPIQQHSDSRHPLKCAIEQIIMTGKAAYCNFPQLLSWSLALVGHDAFYHVKDLNWIMSGGSGQVVWPAIYDTNIVNKHGYLALSWLHGNIRYKNETYNLVKSSDESTIMVNPMDDIQPNPVKGPCNLFPQLKLKWRLKVGDGVLNAGLGLTGMDGRYDFARVSPTILLANLAAAVLVEDCPHEVDSELTDPDRFCKYTGPVNPVQPASLTRDKNYMDIGVVAVNEANDLRLFALACGDKIAPVVLRQSACLLCCLDVCRRTNFPVLIL